MSTLSPLTKGCFHFDPLISKNFIWILYICLALKRTFSFISFRVSSVKTTLLLTKHPMWPYLTHQHKQKKFIKKIYIKTTPLHSFYPFSIHKNGVVSLPFGRGSNPLCPPQTVCACVQCRLLSNSKQPLWHKYFKLRRRI